MTSTRERKGHPLVGVAAGAVTGSFTALIVSSGVGAFGIAAGLAVGIGVAAWVGTGVPPRDVLAAAKMAASCLGWGVVTGLTVGGLGSRLIMRILALVNPDQAGTLTENGNIAGEFTLGGTLGLLVFAGLPPGILGGLLYAVARPWLPGTGALRGLSYGAFLLLAFGHLVIDPDNVDFALFGPEWLGALLFAFLFPAFGLILATLVERGRLAPRRPQSRVVSAVIVVVLAALAVSGGVRLALTVPRFL